jgi:hypothetical protein
MEAFESGEIKSLQELSEKLNIDLSYACRILRLANLAPNIQEAIINGEEPDGLSLNQLRCSVPDDWSEQRAMFGGV